MHEYTSLALAGILFLGITIQWASWWAKLPAILGLLVAGLLLGPATGTINPDELLGDLLFEFVSLGVAVVLFEGALTLKFREIRDHGPVVTNLVSWGAILNWMLMAIGVHYLTNLNWPLSLLFSALVVVTGPTVIMPLLRTVRPTQKVASILRWEGIIIDPLGALFVVLMYEIVAYGAGTSSYIVILKEMGIGSLFGALAAYVLAILLRRHLIPEYLQNVMVLATVLVIFAISNSLSHEAGLIAVTIMGIWLANARGVDVEEMLSFKENLSVIIISALFILLAARVQFADLIEIAPIALPVLGVVLLSRPIVVWLCSINSGLSWREQALLSWIAPRGIVAAAVSALFAIKLEKMNYPGSHLLPALTFMVIVATVLIQSLTSRWIAKKLGVAEAEPNGVLIVGANTFARALALILHKQGYQVCVSSMNWSDIQAAKMSGLPTFFGNPVSAQADRKLELTGIGSMIAISRRPDLNALSCLKYRIEFGKNQVFSLRNDSENDQRASDRISRSFRASRLFNNDITLDQLTQKLEEGGDIKTTALSATFNYEQYCELYGDRSVPLYFVTPKNAIRWVNQHSDKTTPKEGWKITALIMPDTAANNAGKESNNNTEQISENSSSTISLP